MGEDFEGFISVEIGIRTDFGSEAYVKWFEDQGEHVIRLKSPDNFEWYIYFAPIPSADINATIVDLCSMIGGLPPEVRRDWDLAGQQELFVGYDARDGSSIVSDHVGVEALAAMIEVNAGIRYAVYR